MPLTIHSPRRLTARPARSAPVLQVALVNNMPDSALESTEQQFASLLQEASGALPVSLRFAYLPEVPRGAAALERLQERYCSIETLFVEPPDALIVTGMEPLAAKLTDEPYWPRFEQLLDWADRSTVSSLWSCLAAHAAALKLDGIERQRLPRKRCGVFEHEVSTADALLAGAGATLRTPHSRWNELPLAALRAAGYTILSASSESGADIFIRRKRSLFVFCQGHPEYEATSLFKEYRRDVGRFLRGQLPHYPDMPIGYFPPEALTALAAFRETALAGPGAELIERFPSSVGDALRNTWRDGAIGMYRNWLARIDATKRAAGTASVAQVW